MRRRGPDRAHDALADAGDDRLLARAADEPLDVGPQRHARDGTHLDAVLGDGRDRRRLDDLGVDRHLDGLEHVAAGQIDGGRALEGQVDVGLVGRDQRLDNALHVPPGEVVRLEQRRRQEDARLVGRDQRQDDLGRGHVAQPHPDEVAEELHVHTGRDCGHPQPQRDEVEQHDRAEHEREYDHETGTAEECVHQETGE